MNRYLLILLALLSMTACSPKYVKQAGNDNFDSVSPGKAIVIFDAEAKYGVDEGRMLVGFAKLEPYKTQHQLYKKELWEFTTYPGGNIPSYAPEEPHALNAYLVEPGVYVAIRCVFLRPEADYCPAGYWSANGKLADMAYFKVSAGEVVNVGKLYVHRKPDGIYEAMIIDNHDEAKSYINKQRPDLASKLIYKPIKFIQ